MKCAITTAVFFVGSVILASAQTKPFAHTQAAGPVTTNNATLNGMVVPNGDETMAWFEWGTNGSFGEATDPVGVGTATATVRISALITNLSLQQIYHFRLVASNALGVAFGGETLLTTGSRVVWWGRGLDGQGKMPQALSNAVSVASGYYQGVRVNPDGKAFGWDGIYASSTPASLTNCVSAAAGLSYCLGLRSDGTVIGWGGSFGFFPVLDAMPTSLTNLIALAAGKYYALGLRSNGTVVAWGDAEFSQSTNVPSGLSNVVAIAAGYGQSFALKADGNIVGWGVYGGVPASATNMIAISSGLNHAIGLKADGTVLAWGFNQYGQANVPAGMSNILAVAGGGYHSLALKADGTLVAWGRNDYQQTTIAASLTNVAAIAAGYYHNYALGPNLNPQAVSLSVTGAVNGDTVVVLKGQDPNNDALNFRVVTLPTAGTIYQFTNNGRGDVFSSPNSAVFDLLGRLIFAPAQDEAGWPYSSFTFSASDGGPDSTATTATMDIIPVPVINVTSSNGAASQPFSLSFTGDTNAAYRVLASTNLRIWSVLGSAVQSPLGIFNFTDNSATNRPLRFYRVICP